MMMNHIFKFLNFCFVKGYLILKVIYFPLNIYYLYSFAVACLSCMLGTVGLGQNLPKNIKKF